MAFQKGDIVQERADLNENRGTVVGLPDENSEGKYEVEFSSGRIFLDEDELELDAYEEND